MPFFYHVNYNIKTKKNNTDYPSYFHYKYFRLQIALNHLSYTYNVLKILIEFASNCNEYKKKSTKLLIREQY